MNCPRCDQPVERGAYVCGHCGAEMSLVEAQAVGPPHAAPARPRPAGVPPRDIGEDPAMRMLLPVGRSVWAIAAGYAGLVSVLCFPAPIAIVLGIVAIRDIKKHPERHGMGRAIFALVMGVLGTIGLIWTITAAAMEIY